MLQKFLALRGLSGGSGGSGSGGSGGSGAVTSVPKKDVNFYDYDGTRLYAYTVAEAQALTELPALPEREGLTCQGWNYDLETIKAYNRAVDVGATYITDDGTTRIYIHLEEGRTSPMLGVYPNGTVTVDWGDGTTPDTLTGSSITTVQWTPNHAYAKPGDYVIRLTVDGEMRLSGGSTSSQHACILRHSSGTDKRNLAYQSAVRKVEIGAGVTSIDQYSFGSCHNLSSVVIPGSVTNIGEYAFYSCYNLSSIVIPGSVTSIGRYAFNSCCTLSSIVIPDGVTSIGTNAFASCYTLSSIVIPDGVTSIGNSAFYNCYTLSSIVIPDSVTRIDNSAFYTCYNLSSVVIPGSVTSIGTNAFASCFGVCYYDFTRHAAVPTLTSTNTFANIPADCEIRVPAALYDQWVAAASWSTYASNIVGIVTEPTFVCGTVMGGKLEDWNDYQKTRMSAVLTEGETPFPTSFTTPYYLIPVPAKATALTVTCPGLHGGPQFFNLVDGVYTQALDCGWQALDGFTYAIDAGAYGFVAINFKNAANGDFTDDYDTSQIVIRFE